MTIMISYLPPVFYMPGVGVCLMSMGLLLKGNMQIKGNERTFEFIDAQSGKVKVVAFAQLLSDTIYWVNSSGTYHFYDKP